MARSRRTELSDRHQVLRPFCQDRLVQQSGTKKRTINPVMYIFFELTSVIISESMIVDIAEKGLY